MNCVVSPSWSTQLGRRIMTLWWLKGVGTSVFMVLFFQGYFAVMGGGPLFEPVLMPLTPLDAWIPFTPHAFPAYAALWVYVSLPPALLGALRPLLWYGLWVGGLCVFCLAIFWLFPTIVPPAAIDWAQYPQMALIKGLDSAGNACPSLHVASAVFSACWLQRSLSNVGAPRWLAGLSWLICLVIVWSTVAIRQHVVLDVLAGLLVGLAFARVSLHQVGRWYGRQTL